LNKIDLLRKKLEQGIKFGSFVKTYTGPNECDAVCKYMKKKFLSVYKEAQEKLKEEEKASASRLVRVFSTSALDLEPTQQIIIQGTCASLCHCHISPLANLLHSPNQHPL
jgi:hypothetical protein